MARFPAALGPLLLVATLLAAPARPARAQRSEVVGRAAGGAADAAPYRVYHPTPGVAPRALLVLLPGWGGDVDSFAATGLTPSSLPARLAERGVLTVVAPPVRPTLYAGDAALRRLDSTIAAIVSAHRIPPDRVAIGGFSAGGTGAIRYAERCAAGNCRSIPRVAAVFAVDAPLDFERLWRAGALSLRRRPPRANLEEAASVLAELRRTLGGPPERAPAAYRRASPVLASSADGGNAALLRATPVRLYTEPDVAWWMDNRNTDYHGMNAVDHSALVNVLRIAGNDRAELITTSGKGYRPNGTRHPHSWSIVDEADLATWLARVLTD